MEVEDNIEETSGPSKERLLRPKRGTKRERSPDDDKKKERMLVRWTNKEVKDAVTGLDTYGLTRMQSIAELMPGRSAEQVKNWLWRIGREAHKVKTSEQEMDVTVPTVEKKECAPTVIMANLHRGRAHLTNNRQLSAITKSLLLIGNLENHPVSQGNQDIDFKKLYDALYMSMKGYPLPSMNAATLKFFIQSMRHLLKTATAYPIDSFPVDDNKAHENLINNKTFNPLLMNKDLLNARVNAFTLPPYPVPDTMKDWISKHDWNSL